jgi:hypothetical protein
MPWYAAARAALALLFMGLSLPAHAELTAGSLDVTWNAGAQDCNKTSQPPLQVHHYNSRTLVLRENPCATYEAPFMYLLVGETRALLIDTGAVTDAAAMPLARTVRSLLPGGDGGAFPLLVVHTHGHLDHRSGCAVRRRAGTTVLGTTLERCAAVSSRRLAQRHRHDRSRERIVEVLPTPGITVRAVLLRSRHWPLLLRDFFPPGRLLIADAAADLASAGRVAASPRSTR